MKDLVTTPLNTKPGLRQRRDHESQDHEGGAEEARNLCRHGRQRGRNDRTLHWDEHAQPGGGLVLVVQGVRLGNIGA